MSKYSELEEHLSNKRYTWLVTGAAGFIGSNLLEKLLKLNQKVIGLDNFETGYQKNLEEAVRDAKEYLQENSVSIDKEGFTFLEGDIRDFKTCESAIKGVDFVLHQAALGSVPRSIKNPLDSNSSNVDGFLNILFAAKEAKVKSFVYASSSSVYGDSEALPKTESTIGKPLSSYALTKLINEMYSDVFKKNYDFKSIGLRYFNVFGKRQDPKGEYAAVIPKWVDEILEGNEVVINGDGNTSRDFCFIENVIQANLLATFCNKEDLEDFEFNVAIGDRTSLKDLYLLIRGLLLKKDPVLKAQEPTYAEFRTGDVMHSLADIKNLQIKTGYDPTHSVVEGLEETIDWYYSNR